MTDRTPRRPPPRRARAAITLAIHGALIHGVLVLAGLAALAALGGCRPSVADVAAGRRPDASPGLWDAAGDRRDAPRGDGEGWLLGDAGELAPHRDGGVHPLMHEVPPGDRGGESWDGYVHAPLLLSGDDRIRIVFDRRVEGVPRSGVVVFGNAAGPPIATDPNVGYPPGVDHRSSVARGLVEGFEYRFQGALVEERRMRLSFEDSLWSRWCDLQVPVLVRESWSCAPSATMRYGYDYGDIPGGFFPEKCFWYDEVDAALVEADCDRLALCGAEPVCACDAEGCVMSSPTRYELSFALSEDGTAASGPLGELTRVR